MLSGGLTEEQDGMDEESLDVRNPALEFMIRLSEATSKFTVECG